MWRLYGRGYFVGCITKYVERYHLKNGIQDLEKAKHYLEKLIELETAERIATPDPASAKKIKMTYSIEIRDDPEADMAVPTDAGNDGRFAGRPVVEFAGPIPPDPEGEKKLIESIPPELRNTNVPVTVVYEKKSESSLPGEHV